MPTETTKSSEPSDHSEGSSKPARSRFSRSRDYTQDDTSVQGKASVQEPAPKQAEAPKVEAAPQRATSAPKAAVPTGGEDADPYRGKGGCYIIDPKTGKRVRA